MAFSAPSPANPGAAPLPLAAPVAQAALSEAGVWRVAKMLAPTADAYDDDAFHEPLSPTQARIHTTDAFIEGQHFIWQWLSPYQLGWRCTAATLSDLAACGATPLHLMINLGLPPKTQLAQVQDFYSGMAALLQSQGLGPCLIGGDTVGAPQWVVTLHAVGGIEGACAGLKRANAQVGDVLIATGKPGLAHVGWKALECEKSEFFPAASQHFKQPSPQLAAARTLQQLAPTAALTDTSDGLADSLVKIALASGVSLHVESAQLPVHEEVNLAVLEGLIEFAEEALLLGGEDFELVGSLPAAAWQQHQEALQAVGFYAIGHVVAPEAKGLHQAWLHTPQSATPLCLATLLSEGGFDHFKKEEA